MFKLGVRLAVLLPSGRKHGVAAGRFASIPFKLAGANDAQAALKAASDACHAAPNRPEAHYVYGQA